MYNNTIQNSLKWEQNKIGIILDVATTSDSLVEGQTKL